jgi:hypothetical protein
MPLYKKAREKNEIAEPTDGLPNVPTKANKSSVLPNEGVPIHGYYDEQSS